MKLRIVLLSMLALGAPAAVSADPWVIEPGDYFSEFRGSYLSTETFHDGFGERPPLPGGGTYEVRGIQNFTEMGWKKWGSFHLGVPVQSVTRTIGSGLSATQTGIGDLLFGVKVRLSGGKSSALAVDLDFETPAGYDRRLNPALGDGVQNLVGRIEYGTSLPFGFFMASGAYRYRTGVLALADTSMGRAPDDAFHVSADLGIWLGSSVLLAGTYRSALVFEQEQKVEGSVFAHLVGPRILFRVSDRLDVFAGSLHTASAENALHQDVIYAGVSVKDTGLNRFQGFLGNTRKP